VLFSPFVLCTVPLSRRRKFEPIGPRFCCLHRLACTNNLLFIYLDARLILKKVMQNKPNFNYGSTNHYTFSFSSSVTRWRFSPPDLDNSGGFESCLAGIFLFLGGFPISGGFLADLTNSAQIYFCLTDLAEFWRFLSLY
jgi:hypothetical protein